MKLADELKSHGSETSPEDFNDLLDESLADVAPALTAEQLLYRPVDALKVCRIVRAKAGKKLPDEMILRRLNNLRKSREVES